MQVYEVHCIYYIIGTGVYGHIRNSHDHAKATPVVPVLQ